MLHKVPRFSSWSQGSQLRRINETAEGTERTWVSKGMIERLDYPTWDLSYLQTSGDRGKTTCLVVEATFIWVFCYQMPKHFENSLISLAMNMESQFIVGHPNGNKIKGWEGREEIQGQKGQSQLHESSCSHQVWLWLMMANDASCGLDPVPNVFLIEESLSYLHNTQQCNFPSPLYLWQKWAPERFRKLPKVTKVGGQCHSWFTPSRLTTESIHLTPSAMLPMLKS